MNSRLRRMAVILAAVVVPALGAGAPPRISLAPVRDDASGAVTKQLRSLLCADFECVPFSKVRTGGKLDFGKVEALRVAGVVAGTVAKSKKGGKALELAVLKRSLKPAWKGSYPLTKKGTLSPDSAAELAFDVGNLLGGRPSPPPAEPPARAVPPAIAAAPAAATPPVEAPPAAPPPPAAPAPSAAPPKPEPAAVPEEEAPTKAGKPPPPAQPSGAKQTRPLVAVEAGASFSQRTLSYQGVPAGNSALLGYDANLIVSPALRLEFYPVSLLTQNALAGIGLFADYAFSVGLTTQDPSGGADHSTSSSRLGLGLLWRLFPVAQSRFALIPAVSYQSSKFTIGGAAIPGLPDSDLSGFKAGVDAEIPIGGAVAILLGAGYVWWTTAGELVSGAFFPSGSAYAIEADAGVSVGLGGAFALRVLADYSDTRYSLESSPGATYQATGATDRYLGGRAMLRAQF